MNAVRLRFQHVGEPDLPLHQRTVAVVERLPQPAMGRAMTALTVLLTGTAPNSETEIVTCGSPAEIADWLSVQGYEHVLGTNGIWRAAA